MSYRHTIQYLLQNVGAAINKSNDYEANMVTAIEETIAGAGNQTFSNFDVDVSEVESLIMLCDRDITVTVNDDGSPDATISLKADKPLVWNNDGYYLNPLGTVDVTSIKATLAAGADATLRIEVLQDPTP